MEQECKYVKRLGESCTLNNNCKYPKCMKNSNKFIDTVYSKIDIEPLELDRFFHEGFYDDESSVEYNIETLMVFIKNRHKK